jgi:hypothetical protein
MNDLNWISDLAPRVTRTIEKIVAQVKDTIDDAVDIWKRMRTLLDRALMPHPEARAAVMRAFEEELEEAD